MVARCGPLLQLSSTQEGGASLQVPWRLAVKWIKERVVRRTAKLQKSYKRAQTWRSEGLQSTPERDSEQSLQENWQIFNPCTMCYVLSTYSAVQNNIFWISSAPKSTPEGVPKLCYKNYQQSIHKIPKTCESGAQKTSQNYKQIVSKSTFLPPGTPWSAKMRSGTPKSHPKEVSDLENI